MPPLAFLKRVQETQTKNSREFLESILDKKPNFRPKEPCRCPKVAKLLDSQIHSGPKTENDS